MSILKQSFMLLSLGVFFCANGMDKDITQEEQIQKLTKTVEALKKNVSMRDDQITALQKALADLKQLILTVKNGLQYATRELRWDPMLILIVGASLGIGIGMTISNRGAIIEWLRNAGNDSRLLLSQAASNRACVGTVTQVMQK